MHPSWSLLCSPPLFLAAVGAALHLNATPPPHSPSHHPPSLPPQLAKLHRRGKYTELLDSLGQVNIDWVLVRMAQQAYIELAHFELDQRLRLMVVAAARPMLCQ